MRLFGPPPFDMLIFFVTSRCNSVCRTCFYWEELNQEGDLTFEEIGKLSSTMPSFSNLWFSGGEPTLRDELTDVVDLFCANNGVRTVRLPTNGLLTERLVDIVETVCTRHPELTFHVNMALDGRGDTHDSIRGVPGNFEGAVESLRALSPLRQRFPDFHLFVNSVVCKDNHAELVELGDWVRDELDVDGHYFQIIRGNALDSDLLEVPMRSLAEIYRNAMRLYRHYARRSREKPAGMPRSLFEAAYLGVHAFQFETQFANADHEALWKMPCRAGTTSAVLEFDGKVRICELREPIGNVRDHACDWGALWASRARRDEVEQMRRDQCDCTHICFLFDSLKSSRRARYWEVPTRYLKLRAAGGEMDWLSPTRS